MLKQGILAAAIAVASISGAWGAGGVVTDPAGVAPDRYVYYPGTEALDKKEIRVTACGTGMPAARHDQAATCFLMEFGNGDKLIFDIGTGSMANLASYMIPYQYLDKVILSHLHTDHMGDLDALWAGGWTAGRPGGLQVWGPKGLHPELGTKAAIEGFLDFVAWDKETRSFAINPLPGEIEVVEFDYKVEEQVVYEEDGVVVKSFPAIHTGDGPVSFIVEYQGLKVIFGGDTAPNKWFIKYGTNADLVIHEAFMVPERFRCVVQPAAAARVARLLRVPHLRPGIRQDHEHDQAEAGCCVSLPERGGDALQPVRGDPRDLRRPGVDGDGQHGLERHARRRRGAHGGDHRTGMVGAGHRAAGAAREGAPARCSATSRTPATGCPPTRRRTTRWTPHGAVQPAGSGLASGHEEDDAGRAVELVA